MHGGFLGIDIGTSSIKLVQLSSDGTTITLDTYGEIDLGSYGDREPRKAVHLTSNQIAAALLDVIHGANATARKGGMSIPFSATLINVVDLPRRDVDQMEKIIASEVKPLIPVPLESVILNWFVLTDEDPVETSIAAIESKKPIVAQTEKVMLIATEKELVNAYTTIADQNGLTVDFLEVEFFSSTRASKSAALGPALVMDFGATSTKLYVMNGRGTVVATHAVPLGGEAMTESIMKECEWNFEKSEETKRTHGLVKLGEFTPHEHTAIHSAINIVLAKILDDAAHFVKDVSHTGTDAQKVVLIGGGACMPGIIEAVHEKLKIETVQSQPFGYTQVPIILEDVVKEVGPKFAVAVGAALRGMASK